MESRTFCRFYLHTRVLLPIYVLKIGSRTFHKLANSQIIFGQFTKYWIRVNALSEDVEFVIKFSNLYMLSFSYYCVFFFIKQESKTPQCAFVKNVLLSILCLAGAHELRNVMKGDLPFPWKPWFATAPDRSLDKTTAWLGIKTKEQQNRLLSHVGRWIKNNFWVASWQFER